MPKVLMIVGSLRERSLNRQVAKQAEALVGDRAEVAWLDYAGIPFMNQDIESPVPAQIQRVRDEVLAANGIWIATAEYNSNIPGPLKNLLDWLSRPMDPADRHSPSAIKGKPVAISGAAGKSAAS
ncbi:MAG: NAD(P)H-dependent oxidoreductase, partial [Eggerthellaceae bacterium]|nr:NAD(P)H-dependent oxidoreductase [Eggerthellaceae bacterium]